MITYETRTVEKDVPQSITCDICKRTFDCHKDWGEVQEFCHISFVGGYTSIFGDGAEVKADICQDCLKVHMGAYLRVNIGAELT